MKQSIHYYSFTIMTLSVLALTLSAQEIGCGSKCLKCDTAKNICLLCKNNTVVDKENGNCISVPKAIDNCTYYSTSNPEKCKFCKEGFFGDDCSKCNTNCGICQNAQECFVCLPGFSLIEGKCEQKCDVANCHICQKDKTKCNICLKGDHISYKKSYFLIVLII